MGKVLMEMSENELEYQTAVISEVNVWLFQVNEALEKKNQILFFFFFATLWLRVLLRNYVDLYLSDFQIARLCITRKVR